MNRPPRLVIDTNVLVSGFLWHGKPSRLIELAGEKEIRLFTSRTLMNELHATLSKKKLVRFVTATGLSADEMLANYRSISSTVTPRQLAQRVSRDLDDDAVLACALAARADLIISGDDDLLVLEHFQGVAIVSAAEALYRLNAPD